MEKGMEMSEQKGGVGDQDKTDREDREKKLQDNGELEQGVGDKEWRGKERSWLPYPKAVLI